MAIKDMATHALETPANRLIRELRQRGYMTVTDVANFLDVSKPKARELMGKPDKVVRNGLQYNRLYLRYRVEALKGAL